MVQKISTLTERLDGAIEEMKHLVNPKYQAEQRPWLMMGISIVAGYLLSRSILARAEPETAIVNCPDNRTRGRIALGRQNVGFIGGIVSAVVVALARDLAMSLLTKRASHKRRNSDHSGQTTPVGR
jgi:hypothetical protein